MFTSYYTTEARDGYLAASLQPYLGWSVVPRSNPGQEYPSDFSLLRLSGGGSQDKILEALQRHPLVKRVTPQRRLTRTLKFTDEDIPKDRETDWKSRRPAKSSILDSPPGRHWYAGRRLMRAIPSSGDLCPSTQRPLEHGPHWKGVRVAIFDTGLPQNHPHFRHVRDRSNWTTRKAWRRARPRDLRCRVIASSSECLGFAPYSDLYIFRFSQTAQVSYTSWFPRRIQLRHTEEDQCVGVDGNGVIMVSSYRQRWPSLCGTSVASPVVAGAVTLLLGAVDHAHINPASMKQALMDSAQRLGGANIFEQGSGKLDLLRAFHMLNTYKPQATLSLLLALLFPANVLRSTPSHSQRDSSEWYGSAWRIVGKPTWHPYLQHNGQFLEVSVSLPLHPVALVRYLAVSLVVAREGRSFTGVVSWGHLTLTISSPTVSHSPVCSSSGGEDAPIPGHLPIKVSVVPTPPRHRPAAYSGTISTTSATLPATSLGTSQIRTILWTV
ncbi:Membrane-bound transcription factor site-1 protease [Geodia barretti]|nr:Membrane-bound transcription factor site-1 protease [Geodia barretti]